MTDAPSPVCCVFLLSGPNVRLSWFWTGRTWPAGSFCRDAKAVDCGGGVRGRGADGGGDPKEGACVDTRLRVMVVKRSVDA